MSFISSEPLFQQLGYLTLNEHGAIINSGGELENDEKRGEILYRMLTMQHKIEPFLEDGCTVMSVNFKDFSYLVCLSNKKIYIVKRKLDLREDDNFNDTQVSITNSINS